MGPAGLRGHAGWQFPLGRRLHVARSFINYRATRQRLGLAPRPRHQRRPPGRSPLRNWAAASDKLLLALPVVAVVNLRARFLQGGLGGGDGRARRASAPARYARRFGGRQPLVGLIEQRGHFAEPALGSRCGAWPAGRPLVWRRSARARGCRARGSTRGDSRAARPLRARSSARVNGGLVFLGGVPIGARRASGVDGALRLIHLAGRRSPAGGQQETPAQRSVRHSRKRRDATSR